ncbi:MAG: nucleotidyltransferase family protein [Thaumarchaeota archaeon]|nr:nucleotidyltransferase family protein [Nitrososphaerota archaeon]
MERAPPVKRRGDSLRKSKANRISAVLLAAGTSSRFGGTKQLARIDPRGSLIERAVATLKSSRVDHIVVVVGNRSEEVSAKLGRQDRRLRVVVNPAFKTGLSSSLRVGVKAAEKSDAIVIVLADQPLVDSQLIDDIIERHEKTGNPIVVSASGELVSPPALFHRSVYDELQGLEGDVGARPVILSHPGFERVEVDRGTLLDVDTKSDIQRARSIISGPGKGTTKVRGAGRRGRAPPS